MALPPPIPLKPVDRPETWAEYDHRRRITALWRQIGDFVTGSKLSEFLFVAYRGIPFQPLRAAPLRHPRRCAGPGPPPGLADRILGAHGKLLAFDEANDLAPALESVPRTSTRRGR